MKILIELETADTTDLAALTALVASLGGRGIMTRDDVRSQMEEPLAPPTAPRDDTVPLTAPAPPSEELIQQAAAAATPPTDDSGVDIHGLPWDERIHAGTKAKNADGSWRGRRGVDDATVAAVTAELKARVAQPSPEAAFTPPAPEAPAAVAPPPPAPEAPPAPPAPEAPAATGGMTYPKIIELANQKDMTYLQLNEKAAMFGLENFAGLAKRPDLFDAFAAAIA